MDKWTKCITVYIITSILIQQIYSQTEFTSMEVWPKNSIYLEWKGLVTDSISVAYRAQSTSNWITIKHSHTTINSNGRIYKAVVLGLEPVSYEIMLTLNGQSKMQTVDVNPMEMSPSSAASVNALIAFVIIFIIVISLLAIVIGYNCRRDYKTENVTLSSSNNKAENEDQKWYLKSIPFTSKLPCCNKTNGSNSGLSKGDDEPITTTWSPKKKPTAAADKAKTPVRKIKSQGDEENPMYIDPELRHNSSPPAAANEHSTLPTATNKARGKQYYANQQLSVPPITNKKGATYLSMDSASSKNQQKNIVDQVHNDYLAVVVEKGLYMNTEVNDANTQKGGKKGAKSVTGYHDEDHGYVPPLPAKNSKTVDGDYSYTNSAAVNDRDADSDSYEDEYEIT